MNIRIFIIICTVLRKCISLVVYPDGSPEGWIDIPVGNLSCPSPDDIFDIKGEAKWTSIAYPHDRADKTMIEGYFCHGIVSVATCEVFFWGQQDRKCSHSTWSPTEEDCKMAYQSFISGNTEAETCSHFECVWLDKRTTMRKQISILKETVGVDRYTESYMHPLFPEGTCKKSPCTTRSDSIIWIGPDYNHKSLCVMYEQPFESEMIYEGGKPSLIKNTLYGDLNMEGSCLIEYCGQNLTRVRNGVTLKTGVVPPNLLQCTKETRAGIIPDWIRDDELRYFTYSEIEYELCLDTVSTMIETNKASWLQLSRLYPRTPGYHKAYRLTEDGRLQVNLLRFQPGFKKENGTLVGDLESHFLWKGWTKTQTGWRGPSGILRDLDGTIHTPHEREYRKFHHILSIEAYIVQPPRHPSVHLLPRNEQGDFFEEYTQSVEEEGTTIRILKYYVFLSIISIVTALLIVLVTKALIKVTKKRKSEKNVSRALNPRVTISYHPKRTDIIDNLD